MARRLSERTRAGARLEGRRLAGELAQTLGSRVRTARKRRRLSLYQLAARVGITPARLSQIELGDGGGAPLEVWLSLGIALEITFKAEFWHDRAAEPDDAGHLAIQELALRLARKSGRSRFFELQVKPSGSSIDVCVRDDALRELVIEECWNTFGNVNASIRATNRKVTEARDLAVAFGGDDGPFLVSACWIVRDTRRNRELVARYPEVFSTAFAGSSRQWVRSLTTAGSSPPAQAGLVWCDNRATRVFAWRA